MRLGLVGLAIHDVNAAAIGFPPGYARRIMLVSVSDPLVIFFAIFVFVCVRIGIPTAPKLFDEMLSLVVGFEFLKRLSLLVRDDVGDIFVQPILVGFVEFLLNIALFL